MELKQTVTFFHRETENKQELWSAVVLNGVCVTQVHQSSPFSQGMEPDNHLVVRIPSKTDLLIKPGDRMVMGKEETVDCNSPLFQNAYLVRAVTDNRKGSGNLWHYKVVCQ